MAQDTILMLKITYLPCIFNTYTKYKDTRPEDKKVLPLTKLCAIKYQLFDFMVKGQGDSDLSFLYLKLCHVLIHIHTKHESSVF